MRPVRSSRVASRLLMVVCLLGMLVSSGLSASASPVRETAVQTAQQQTDVTDPVVAPMATSKKHGPSFVYAKNPIYRAKIYTVVATNDGKTVNDVRYCIFAMQKNFGAAGWKTYTWNDLGYTVYEYDHTTGQEIANTTKSGSGPSANPEWVKMRSGNNLPESHRVGCYISVVGNLSTKGAAMGYVFD